MYDLLLAGPEHMGTLQMSVASLFYCAGRRFLSLPGILNRSLWIIVTFYDRVCVLLSLVLAYYSLSVGLNCQKKEQHDWPIY